jgi:hypothetical protein
MAYFPPVQKEAVREAEIHFLVFFSLALIPLFVEGVIRIFGISRTYWCRESLLIVSTYIAFVATVHSTFFDIARISNPQNRILQPDSFSPWVKALESGVNWLGVIAACLSIWLACRDKV